MRYFTEREARGLSTSSPRRSALGRPSEAPGSASAGGTSPSGCRPRDGGPAARVQVFQGQIGAIELAAVEAILDDPADELFDLVLVARVVGARLGFCPVGQHQDRRLLGARARGGGGGMLSVEWGPLPPRVPP